MLTNTTNTSYIEIPGSDLPADLTPSDNFRIIADVVIRAFEGVADTWVDVVQATGFFTLQWRRRATNALQVRVLDGAGVQAGISGSFGGVGTVGDRLTISLFHTAGTSACRLNARGYFAGAPAGITTNATLATVAAPTAMRIGASAGASATMSLLSVSFKVTTVFPAGADISTFLTAGWASGSEFYWQLVGTGTGSGTAADGIAATDFFYGHGPCGDQTDNALGDALLDTGFPCYNGGTRTNILSAVTLNGTWTWGDPMADVTVAAYFDPDLTPSWNIPLTGVAIAAPKTGRMFSHTLTSPLEVWSYGRSRNVGTTVTDADIDFSCRNYSNGLYLSQKAKMCGFGAAFFPPGNAAYMPFFGDEATPIMGTPGGIYFDETAVISTEVLGSYVGSMDFNWARTFGRAGTCGSDGGYGSALVIPSGEAAYFGFKHIPGTLLGANTDAADILISILQFPEAGQAAWELQSRATPSNTTPTGTCGVTGIYNPSTDPTSTHLIIEGDSEWSVTGTDTLLASGEDYSTSIPAGAYVIFKQDDDHIQINKVASSVFSGGDTTVTFEFDLVDDVGNPGTTLYVFATLTSYTVSESVPSIASFSGAGAGDFRGIEIGATLGPVVVIYYRVKKPGVGGICPCICGYNGGSFGSHLAQSFSDLPWTQLIGANSVHLMDAAGLASDETDRINFTAALKAQSPNAEIFWWVCGETANQNVSPTNFIEPIFDSSRPSYVGVLNPGMSSDMGPWYRILNWAGHHDDAHPSAHYMKRSWDILFDETSPQFGGESTNGGGGGGIGSSGTSYPFGFRNRIDTSRAHP